MDTDTEPAASGKTEPTDLSLRTAQLELDRERFLFEKEIEHKKLRTSLYSSGIVLALIGGFIAIFSNAFQGYLNLRLERQKSQASLSLERQKSQASIILKAIETGNTKSSANNLLFLLRAGILDDPTHRIENLLKKPDEAPVLPAVRLGQDGPYLKADLNTYCQNRYGSPFHAVDGQCSDGVRNYKIDPEEVCNILTGSSDYSIDSASMEIHCTGQRESRKDQR